MSGRKSLGGLLSFVLAANTVMSFGMGMSMAAGPEDQEAAAHACCPGAQSPDGSEDTPAELDCCLDMPVIHTGAQRLRSDDGRSAYLNKGPEVGNAAVASEARAARAPPLIASSHSGPPTSRAPPVV